MNPENSSEGNVSSNSSSPMQKDDFAKFSDHPTFNFALGIGWLVAIFSIVAMGFLWWLNKGELTTLADKNTEKTALAQQLGSTENVAIEKKANDFKAAVSALKAASSTRYSMTDFLTGFYTKITNDVVLDAFSVSPDDSISLTGTTKSYRSVADLMLALKSWEKLKDVDLATVLFDEESNETKFTITAKINKVTATGTEGGTNEGI